jgi:phage baseplate assembly protein V
MSWELSELERKLHAMIRVGVVKTIDETKRMIVLSIGDVDTPDVHWAMQRCGEDDEWDPPSVGEQMLILACAGDPAQAFAVLSIPQDGFGRPRGATEHVRTYRDSGAIKYNWALSSYEVAVPPQGAIELKTGPSSKIIVRADGVTIVAPTVTITSPATTISGTLTVNGLTTLAGGLAVLGPMTVVGDIACGGNVLAAANVIAMSTSPSPVPLA